MRSDLTGRLGICALRSNSVLMDCLTFANFPTRQALTGVDSIWTFTSMEKSAAAIMSPSSESFRQIQPKKPDADVVLISVDGVDERTVVAVDKSTHVVGGGIVVVEAGTVAVEARTMVVEA